MKKFFVTLFIIFTCIFVPAFSNENLYSQNGIVTAVEYIDTEELSENNENNIQTKQLVTVKLTNGKFKNEEVTIENMLTSNPAYDILLEKGDRIILQVEPKGELIEDTSDLNFYISDIKRVNSIYVLLGIFFALLLFIGKKKGLFSFVSIILTVGLIFFGLTPMILNGISPIFASLVTCIISTILTIYLVSGFNRKSTSAIIGTVSSLSLSAIFSVCTIKLATLTGFAGEESMFLYSTRPDLSFTGILTASMMLAALGAVMDVGVSIASTINEIYCANETYSIKKLFKSGMNVGRDIIGTMSNTLILVYLGSSLPLMLLANNIDFNKFFNLNQVVTEISSALIGSISILICVPITAIVSAYLIKNIKKSN